MLRAYKAEINPSKSQMQKINQSIGICRWLYNQYLDKNQELYKQFEDGLIDKKEAFISANNFDKYINNEMKVQSEYSWINSCGSKARKKAICNAETSYKRFFKGQSGFPKFKKKNKQQVKLYFPKNNKTDFKVERHKINIPTLKWVHLKEKGYIPTDKKVISGTVSKKGNRYYISILIEENIYSKLSPIKNEGIGIDLGVKDLATCSNEMIFKNINKTHKVKKLEKKLKREQRKLSRKYESLKKKNKKIKEGRATRQNIQKQIVKVQRLHQKLAHIRTDYINKIVYSIVKQNPSYITIEDLNIRGMMKNKHLSKAIAQQKLSEFRVKLTYKCMLNNIELRVVDRWYPSSKICSSCGSINKNLKLKDRVYKCKCELVIDRDLNASYNLKNAEIYKVA